MAAFLKLSSGKRLVRDNKTRWNSWYAMIDCAIQERIRLVVDLYCHQAGKEMQADSLSAEDWAVLTKYPSLLEIFSSGNIGNRGPCGYSRESTVDNGVLAGAIGDWQAGILK